LRVLAPEPFSFGLLSFHLVNEWLVGYFRSLFFCPFLSVLWADSLRASIVLDPPTPPPRTFLETGSDFIVIAFSWQIFSDSLIFSPFG